MVFLKAGSTLNGAELLHSIRASKLLAAFKIPQQQNIFFTSEALPRGDTGALYRLIMAYATKAYRYHRSISTGAWKHCTRISQFSIEIINIAYIAIALHGMTCVGITEQRASTTQHNTTEHSTAQHM